MLLNRRPDIERFLSAPTAGVRAALIFGRDLGVMRERAQALAQKVAARPDDPFDVGLVSEGDLDADPGRLADELMAFSMTGGRRLVRLRLSTERAGPDKLAAEALERHAAGEYNPEAFFLVEAGNLGRDSALRRAAEKSQGAAAIPCYEDEIGDLARLTRESLAKDHVSLSPDALDVFVRRLPHERGVARREIERLALFLGPGSGAAGSAADLEDFLGVEPEASLSDAAQDAFGGRLAAAQAGLRRAAQEGEGGPAAVRAMSQHLARLRRTATLREAGAELAEAAKAAGVFWKNEREFLRQARAWSLVALSEVQPELLAADRACKQTGAPDRLIAERLALAIAARARRLGL
ncbi:MAG: DNA polymerase III subunit delta [Caulobacteraceae bacterium]